MEKISFKPIWFDSLGAKSACTLVKTKDIKILIDPGVAIMQPSFPASFAKKLYWKEKGKKEIKNASKIADVIIISHYHYDHYFPNDLSIYKNKLLFVKNPNEYINDSQRKRAEKFFEKICKRFGKIELEEILEKKKAKVYVDVFDRLEIAKKKSFGNYNKRRKELLKLGKKWFENRAKNWNENLRIPELKFKDLEIKFGDGKKFEFGKTKIRFTSPLFHGLEYSRVGWVFACVIECGKQKLIYSSDLNGPIIEDYADWIIKENPDFLILDGPMTYMFGYLLNKINLSRAIENACRIVRNVKAEIIIYDHHLPRERKFRERTKKVWEIGKKEGKKVLTAAEFFGKKPVILTL